ncbi:MAG: aminotransferase class III-fold pyridoxal phosphate-dependent enzyme [Deltaproteobacteria bacterium]|jgi:putrescine aminotransferase|nr:aminotransferase class III-fold pyridoxal phosphate-dependent enzyme [Deltaproteobacteria bacterium]
MKKVKDIYKEFCTVDDAVKFDFETVKRLQSVYSNKLKLELSGAKYFVRAENATLIDHEGNKHVDMMGAVGVMTVGNNNPFVWEQIAKVWDAKCYSMGAVSYHNIASALYRDLALTTPGQKLTKAQTAGGGAEAIEGALKLCKIANRNKPHKTKILATIGAFHGKTTGAVSAGGKDTWQAYQGRLLLDETFHIPFNDVAALEKELSKGIYQGFFVEPIQGEGGVFVASDEFMQKARELCDKYETYLVCDEIQTGLCRTGKFWASEWYGIVPDIITFAKGISGGIMPLAGYIAKPEVFDAAYGTPETAFHHTATYQGSAYACAAGIGALQFMLENDLCGEAEKKGKIIKEAMLAAQKKYPGIIKEIRGRGCLIGVEFNPTKAGLEDKYGPNWAMECERYFSTEFRIQIMHSFNNPKVFRWLPPLTAPMEDVEYALKAFDASVKHVYDLANK